MVNGVRLEAESSKLKAESKRFEAQSAGLKDQCSRKTSVSSNRTPHIVYSYIMTEFIHGKKG
jgi:hypothetical protein